LLRAIPQAIILLGLSGGGLSGEGKTENELLLVERFGTLFRIGLLSQFTKPKLHPIKTGRIFRQSSQTALTLKGHYHNIHNFTVLFQLHSVEIYIKHRKIMFLTAQGLNIKTK
jgi:hypothetical protein